MSEAPPDAPSTPDGLTAKHDPLVGARLGDYLVQERIGAGGMGLVYAGVHPVIGKKVAIKVLQWESARNPDDVARLKAEARLVNAIGHRGIVDIYDFGTTPDGRDFVVMELLTGEPLDRVIEDRAPLPAPEVLSILEEICDALAAAHAAGVIHRDLKPSNVFQVVPLRGTRYLKLLDFGLAKQAAVPHGSSAQTRQSMVVGTPYYMAPEQARGLPVSPQTDLYALGVLAFELATGKLPYDAPTPFEVITKHLTMPVPSACALAPAVPRALDALVKRLLSKDPAGRPASAVEVHAEVRQIKGRLQSGTTLPAKALGTVLPMPTTPTIEFGQRSTPSLPAQFPAGEPSAKIAPRRSEAAVFVGGAGLVLAATVGAAFWLSRPAPAAPAPSAVPVPAPTPAPPPEVLPPPPPPIAPEPTPSPTPTATPQPQPPPKPLLRPLKNPPRPKDPNEFRRKLLQRIDRLLAHLEEQAKATGTQDTLNETLLMSLREKTAHAKSIPELLKLEEDLKRFEGRLSR